MSASLLFDLDGTLVDTDKAHFGAFGEAFAPYDVAIDWEIYRTRIMGAANSAITREFLGHVPESEHEAIMDRKEALYRAGVGEIEPVAGLAALLDSRGRGGHSLRRRHQRAATQCRSGPERSEDRGSVQGARHRG